MVMLVAVRPFPKKLVVSAVPVTPGVTVNWANNEFALMAMKEKRASILRIFRFLLAIKR
jgi:hypothetical protein